MKTHDKKRFKRLLDDLYFMRQDIMTEIEDGDRNRVPLIKHIDPLIKAIHKLLGEEPQKLEKVPKARSKKKGEK